MRWWRLLSAAERTDARFQAQRKLARRIFLARLPTEWRLAGHARRTTSGYRSDGSGTICFKLYAPLSASWWDKRTLGGQRSGTGRSALATKRQQGVAGGPAPTPTVKGNKYEPFDEYDNQACAASDPCRGGWMKGE